MCIACEILTCRFEDGQCNCHGEVIFVFGSVFLCQIRTRSRVVVVKAIATLTVVKRNVMVIIKQAGNGMVTKTSTYQKEELSLTSQICDK